MIRACYILLFLAVFSGQTFAADMPPEFSSEDYKVRYYDLIEEIRCLVCQNQNLADSHADLAQDLRNLIVNKINEGKSNDEIIRFLTERYGDFVLYRPPVKSNTMLLWIGPFVFLIIALIVLIRNIANRRGDTESVTEITGDEHNRISAILDEDDTRK